MDFNFWLPLLIIASSFITGLLIFFVAESNVRLRTALNLFGAFLKLGLVIWLIWGVFDELPSYEHLENPQTNLATEIISSDGETLGKFYLDDNRTPVKYEDLPKNLVDALIASEDIRFHEHSGIDARGTLRAFFILCRDR